MTAPGARTTVGLMPQQLRASVIDLNENRASLWARASTTTASGRPVLDFPVDGSLMRPRYLIRLFETARRRTVTFVRGKIGEEVYSVAPKERGWQVLEDLDRAIADLVPKESNLLFEILQQRKISPLRSLVQSE